MSYVGRAIALKELEGGRERTHLRHIKAVNLYEATPKLCEYCFKPLEYRKRKYKYCSRHCSVTVNNNGVVRNGDIRVEKACAACGNITLNPKYCSRLCYGANKHLQAVKAIEDGTFKSVACSDTLKKYLIKKRGRSCEQCGLSVWQTNPIPLNIHHIDGDGSNNSLHNVQLLCLNCHGLTDNFGTKNNHKSTRTYRYAKS